MSHEDIAKALAALSGTVNLTDRRTADDRKLRSYLAAVERIDGEDR